MDVYNAPKSNVAEKRKGNKVKAVLIGMAVDYGLTILVSIVAGIVLSAIFIGQGIPEGELEQKISNALSTHSFPLVSYSLMTFGLFASFLGGYYTARIANDKEYLLVGVLSLFAILFTVLSKNDTYSLLETGVLLSANIVVLFLGAYAHVRNKL